MYHTEVKVVVVLVKPPEIHIFPPNMYAVHDWLNTTGPDSPSICLEDVQILLSIL